MKVLINNYRNINLVIWVLSFGTMISRLGTSMTTPFMSFFLHEKVGLSLTDSGMIIGVSFLAYAFGGFWGGALSDLLGRRILLLVSLGLYALVFIGFAIANTYIVNITLLGFVFAGLNLISGVCRACYETLSQASIADFAASNQKAAAFGLRYTAANIGTAIGPLIGTALGFSGGVAGFYLTGSIILSYFFILVFFINKKQYQMNHFHTEKKHSLMQALNIILQDRSMLWLTFGGVLIYFGFVQQEALFGQIIYINFHSLKLFPVLIAINALMVIVLQIPLSYYLAKFSTLNVIMVGAVLLSFGLLLIGSAGKDRFCYLAGEVIFTCGEIFIFSFMNVLVDQLAPKSLRGAYFGAQGLQFLGRAFGPVIGGFFIQRFGVSFAMLFVSSIVVTSVLPFWLGAKNMVPEYNKNIAGE